jgi:hypothetical protein
VDVFVCADTFETGAPPTDVLVVIPVVVVLLETVVTSACLSPTELAGPVDVDEEVAVVVPSPAVAPLGVPVAALPGSVWSAKAIAPPLLHTRRPIESAQAPAALRR